MKGQVLQYDENAGVGVIRNDSGANVFVHFSFIRMEGFKTLHAGDLVEFDEVHGPRGLEARNVKCRPRR